MLLGLITTNKITIVQLKVSKCEYCIIIQSNLSDSKNRSFLDRLEQIFIAQGDIQNIVRACRHASWV